MVHLSSTTTSKAESTLQALVKLDPSSVSVALQYIASLSPSCLQSLHHLVKIQNNSLYKTLTTSTIYNDALQETLPQI